MANNNYAQTDLAKALEEGKKLYNSFDDFDDQLNKNSAERRNTALKELVRRESDAREKLEKEIEELELKGFKLNIDERKKLQKQAQLDYAKKERELEISTLQLIVGMKSIEQKKLALEDEAQQKKLDNLQRQREGKDLKSLNKQAKYDKSIKNTQDYKDAKAAAKDEQKAANRFALFEGLTKQFSEFTEQKKMTPAERRAEARSKNLLGMVKSVGKALSDGLNKINSTIESYSKARLAVNTRLNGATVSTKGSSKDLDFAYLIDELSSIAYSPLISAEKLYSNVETLVSSGIASNISQRALMMTLSEGVVTTFEANSDTLKKMIKLQQADSTAARMGMEYYLNSWLNEYIQNTEYLTSTFDTVATSLMEASAMLQNKTGITGSSEEFEFIVQKWLGTLTGVGFSDQTATSIAEALGKLGSGDVDFFSSPIGVLLTLSSSKAGLDIGELISEGLDAVDTNKILNALTEYLQSLADESSNVVKNQLAKTFGVSVTDLIAVTNLNNLQDVYDNVLSYRDMYMQLEEGLSGLAGREGIQGIIQNALSNYTYQTGMDIASNPVMNVTWALADLVNSVTGGINIPHITALGSGIGFEATAENLIKLSMIGLSTLGNIGNIVNGVRTVGDATTLLTSVGIGEGNEAIKTRGNGLDKTAGKTRVSSTTSSISNYVGNESGDDYYESSVNKAEDEQSSKVKAKTSEAKEEDPVAEYLNDMDFASSFKAMAKNVKNMSDDTEKIYKKLNNGTIKVDADIGKISGFFTGADGSQGTWSIGK